MSGGTLRNPRKLRRNHWWIDLRLNLLVNSGFCGTLVNAIGPNPAQDLLLSQVFVGCKCGARWCWDRAGGVDRSVVCTVCASASPMHVKNHIGFAAFLRVAVHCGNGPSCSGGHDESFRRLSKCDCGSACCSVRAANRDTEGRVVNDAECQCAVGSQRSSSGVDCLNQVTAGVDTGAFGA